MSGEEFVESGGRSSRNLKGFALPGTLEVIDDPSGSAWDDERVETESSKNGRGPKKRGRKRMNEVLTIVNPDVNPALANRESEIVEDQSNVSRLFVDDPGSGMHFDWPIYSNAPIRLREAARIILTDAAELSPEYICDSIPQEFTGAAGVFVVALRALVGGMTSITQDSLGRWGRPSSSSFFYNEQGERLHGHGQFTYIKIISERYTHPGTESIGKFYKTIYTGMTSNGDTTGFAVIAYHWEGEPHAVAVMDEPRIQRTARSALTRMSLAHKVGETRDVDLSVESGEMVGGVPLFSPFAVDFDAVCRLLLGAVDVETHRTCDTIPASLARPGTFIVDVEKCGGERVLWCAGGGRWSRPSGAARFFRNDEDGHWTRVDKMGRVEEGTEWHVQISTKRYDSSTVPHLMRKIYVIREKEPGSRAVHSALAVITFYWKAERRVEEPQQPSTSTMFTKPPPLASFKRPRMAGDMLDDADWYGPGTSSLGPAEQLKRMAQMAEAQNHTRLDAIMDKAESFLNRFESMISVMQQRRGEDVYWEGSEVVVKRGDEDQQEEVLVEEQAGGVGQDEAMQHVAKEEQQQREEVPHSEGSAMPEQLLESSVDEGT